MRILLGEMPAWLADDKFYHPSLVSIGPFRHGKPHLQPMEEHKIRILGEFRDGGVEFTGLFMAAEIEEKIRLFYPQELGPREELIEMMILDGCFIIYILCKFESMDEPLITLLPTLMNDFLLLENQIPFFVLESLYSLLRPTLTAAEVSFTQIALKFFSSRIPFIDQARHRLVQASHLLCLVRSSMVDFLPNQNQSRIQAEYQPVPSASLLVECGIQIKPRNNADLLDIKCRRGGGVHIEIPPIRIDDFIVSILLNLIEYERCCSYMIPSRHISSYILFIRSLIWSQKDATYLIDHGIIENHLGTQEQICQFFGYINVQPNFISHNYLTDMCEEVNWYTTKYVGFKYPLRSACVLLSVIGAAWIFRGILRM